VAAGEVVGGRDHARLERAGSGPVVALRRFSGAGLDEVRTHGV
jgi:hypothetical protein